MKRVTGKSDCSLGKPNRDVTGLPHGIVVIWQVTHHIFGRGELVAAALGVFVRHWLFLRLESSRIMPVRPKGPGLWIYATTP